MAPGPRPGGRLAFHTINRIVFVAGGAGAGAGGSFVVADNAATRRADGVVVRQALLSGGEGRLGVAAQHLVGGDVPAPLQDAEAGGIIRGKAQP